MIYWALPICALLLSLERIAYVWISCKPDSWLALARRPLVARMGEPVAVVRLLFIAFKILQIGVFLGWCVAFSGAGMPLPTTEPGALLAGTALLAVGQFLNVAVFRQLGGTTVFFGGELGHDVRWVSGFPFSVLRHPQYVGAVLSIWGFFLIMRFPHEDWLVLPLLETAFYVVGAHYEA